MAAMSRSIDPASIGRLLPRRDRVVHVRFSAADSAAIERAASAADLTVSAFMRSLVLEGAGVRPFFTEEDHVILKWLRDDIRVVGINLDQIARRLNGSESGDGAL